MKRKIRILILCMAISIVLVSCVREEEPDSVEEDTRHEDEEELDLEDILSLTLERSDERDNYRLEYVSEYHFRSEDMDLEDEDLEKLDFEGDELDTVEINEREIVHHYQDGRGNFKTVLERDDGDKLEEKILTYNKDLYIFYDSELGDGGPVAKTWKDIVDGNYEEEVPGFVVMKSEEEFNDFKDSSGLDLPRNPLKDAKDLLEIYKHTDMYKVKRLRESENDSQYVVSLKSYEEDADIVFYIDKEDFYIRSYRGNNGDSIFSGRVVDLERYVDYDRGFFDLPSRNQ